MLSSIIWMLAISDYANMAIKKQVRLSRSDDMSKGSLLSMGAAMVLHCGFILSYFRDMNVQKQLILIAPSVKGTIRRPSPSRKKAGERKKTQDAARW